MRDSNGNFVNAEAAEAFHKGLIRGELRGILMFREKLIEKADDASCSVSVFDIEKVAEEMLREMQNENS